MSKNVLSVALFHPFDVEWDPTAQQDERASSYGTIQSRALEIPSLYWGNGWLQSGEGILPAEEIPAKKVKAFLDSRKAYLHKLRESSFTFRLRKSEGEGDKPVDATSLDVANFLEDNGWLTRSPKVCPFAGHRRGAEGMIGAAMLSASRSGFKGDFLIPIQLVSPKTEWERLQIRLASNTHAGQVSYSLIDLAALAVKMVGSLEIASESTVGHVLNLSRNTRQKLFALAQIAVRYPRLEIVKRLRMLPAYDDKGRALKEQPYFKGGYIPLGPITGNDLRSLRDGATSAVLSGAAKNCRPVDHQGKPALESEVERYFELLLTGGKGKARATTGKTMESLAQRVRPESAAYALLTAASTGQDAKVSESVNRILTLEEKYNTLATAVKGMDSKIVAAISAKCGFDL